MTNLTHLNDAGDAHMVDVSAKDITTREASASAVVHMQASTLELIYDGKAAKGDVLAVARIAGIQAAKRCSELIPLCHPLALTKVAVTFEKQSATELKVAAMCRVNGQTGVEMEALTAVSVAALTVYDMCKAVDRGMIINHTALDEKLGGKSGHWQRSQEPTS